MLKKGILIAVIFVICSVGIWTLSNSRTFQVFGDIVSRVDTDKKIVALTFDDGPWNARYTNKVIQILDKLNVKATFFINGRGIENNPEDAKHLVAAGHELGNHSYSHDRLIFKSYDRIKREIENTNSLIRSVGFSGEIFFRPPYGKKLLILPYYLNQNGITTVTCDVEPESYKKHSKSADSIADYVIDKSKSGSIILLHVMGSKNSTARESLPLIIHGLRNKGFRFVKLSELMQ